MTVPSTTLLGLAAWITPSEDPHAGHRRDALTRQRTLRRARRRALVTRLNLLG